MQQFDNPGPVLLIEPTQWTRFKVREVFLSLLPKGPLFDAYRLDDTVKSCLTTAIVEMLYTYLNQHNSTMKQLNWTQADTLLKSWEKLCLTKGDGLTIEQRRLNVAIKLGLTKKIVSLEDLKAFINYLGLQFISVTHLTEHLKDEQIFYDSVYDSVYYGQTLLDYGLVWTLDKNMPENNQKLKDVLKRLSIQTARHIFEEIEV